jgi:hypothetical protein
MISRFLRYTLFFLYSIVELTPYNAKNGIEDRMYDPTRVVCITDDNDVVIQAPCYTYQ